MKNFNLIFFLFVPFTTQFQSFQLDLAKSDSKSVKFDALLMIDLLSSETVFLMFSLVLPPMKLSINSYVKKCTKMKQKTKTK